MQYLLFQRREAGDWMLKLHNDCKPLMQVRTIGSEEFQKLKTMLNVMKRDCGRPTSPGGRGRGRGRGQDSLQDERGDWGTGVSPLVLAEVCWLLLSNGHTLLHRQED